MAVVIGFFVCWAPFHAQRLLYVYAKESPSYRHANEVMFYITGELKSNSQSFKFISNCLRLFNFRLFLLFGVNDQSDPLQRHICAISGSLSQDHFLLLSQQ